MVIRSPEWEHVIVFIEIVSDYHLYFRLPLPAGRPYQR